MESLVVPAILVTMFLSSPIKAFNKEDFPTLGLPTIANLGIPSSSSSSGISFRLLITSSKSSPVPLPLMEEILKISSEIPKP